MPDVVDGMPPALLDDDGNIAGDMVAMRPFSGRLVNVGVVVAVERLTPNGAGELDTSDWDDGS